MNPRSCPLDLGTPRSQPSEHPNFAATFQTLDTGERRCVACQPLICFEMEQKSRTVAITVVRATRTPTTFVARVKLWRRMRRGGLTPSRKFNGELVRSDPIVRRSRRFEDSFPTTSAWRIWIGAQLLGGELVRPSLLPCLLNVGVGYRRTLRLIVLVSVLLEMNTICLGLSRLGIWEVFEVSVNRVH